jgi:fluoride exporter
MGGSYYFVRQNNKKTFVKFIFLVGLGSFIGGSLRYLITQTIQLKTLQAFPFGTLAVNIAGCFLIGVAFSLGEKGNLSESWRLFLAPGILGGFTTFSSFTNESLTMISAGETLQAFSYILLSITIGLAANYAGILLIKQL